VVSLFLCTFASETHNSVGNNLKNNLIMISAEEAKKYTKAFEPKKCDIDSIENQIKSGERHIKVWTTMYTRSYAEDLARYCRQHGYTNAHIHDVYNQRTWQKGGNYLKIDLE
jgi:hypothetical protein